MIFTDLFKLPNEVVLCSLEVSDIAWGNIFQSWHILEIMVVSEEVWHAIKAKLKLLEHLVEGHEDFENLVEDDLSSLRRNILTADWSRTEKFYTSAVFLFEFHSSRQEFFILADLIEAIVWEEFVHYSRQSTANISYKIILSIKVDFRSLLIEFLESSLFIIFIFFIVIVAFLAKFIKVFEMFLTTSVILNCLLVIGKLFS